MTNSTFYHDGFRDAKQGLPATPPDANVYATEYMAGYEDACETNQPGSQTA